MQIKGNDISMTRGDSEAITVSCADVNGVVVPLVSGDTIYFTVKESIYTKVIIIQKVIIAFSAGTAVIEIKHVDTENIPYGNYCYDIQLTKDDGIVTTIIPPSKFSITGEVTYE